MAFDVIIRALFTDSGLSAGLAKTNAALSRLGQSGPGARAGLRAIEGGIRALAFEAAGLQGPVGKVSEGLLKFGGGSALVLGATAGIGLIAKTYEIASREARELAAANDKLNESWRALVARGAPTVQMQNDLLEAVKRLGEEQDKLAGMQARQFMQVQAPGGVSLGQLISTPGAIPRQEANVAAAQRIVDELREQLGTAHVQLMADASKRAMQFARAFVDGIKDLDPGSRIAALLKAQPQFEAGGRAAGRIWAESFQEAAEALLERGLDIEGHPLRFVGPPRGFVPGVNEEKGGLFPGAKARKEILSKAVLEEIAIVDRPARVASEGVRMRDEMRVVAESLALAGAFRGGRPGDVIGGLGGVSTSLGALKGLGGFAPIGLGLTALGGAINLFDNNQERRHRELVRSIEKLGQEVGLDRVTLVLTGPDGHQTRRTLAELEASDAVERIPGPVGARG